MPSEDDNHVREDVACERKMSALEWEVEAVRREGRRERVGGSNVNLVVKGQELINSCR